MSSGTVVNQAGRHQWQATISSAGSSPGSRERRRKELEPQNGVDGETPRDSYAVMPGSFLGILSQLGWSAPTGRLSSPRPLFHKAKGPAPVHAIESLDNFISIKNGY